MAELNKAQLQSENNNSFPDNNAGAITPAILRNFNSDMIDSLVDEITYNTDSASFSASIAELQNFSASLDTNFASQAEFNSYTASQNAVNAYQNFLNGTFATTGSNTFVGDQYLNANLHVSGTNYIDFNGGLLRIGEANNGVSLIDGFDGIQIRNYTSNDLDIEQNADAFINIDNNSGSIGITAHAVGESVLISASAITLNGVDFIPFSSSVDTRLGSSLVTASVSQSTITFTKGDGSQFNITVADVSGSAGDFVTTASFNSFTQSYQTDSASFNSRILSITGSTINTSSFATTGSNTFVGNQLLTGSLTISSSATYDIDIIGGFRATAASQISQSTGAGIVALNPTFVAVASSSVQVLVGRGYAAITNGGNNISLNAGPVPFGSQNNAPAGGGIGVYNNANSYYFPIQFQATASYTDGRVTISTPLSASAGITSSDAYINGALYSVTSASFNSRLLAATGSGGSAVGAITTGSNGQQQYITGSLGVNTLNQVLAINSTYTASTTALTNEGTASAEFYISYGNVPGTNPSIYNVDNSGNWTVSGTGASNNVVTNVTYDDNGVFIQATGATFSNGANYTFTAASYVNYINISGGQIQLQADANDNATVQAGLSNGAGKYPGFRTVVNTATNPGDIYSFIAMDDAGGDGSKNFGLSLNTYTNFGPGLVGVIYGGGNYNGTSDALYFVSSSIRVQKPITFNAPTTFNSNTPIYINSVVSASNGFNALNSTNGVLFNPSTSSIANSYTRYNKDGFQIYQYQGQAYAFGVICTSDQLNSYTGSQFRWGTVDGSGAIVNYMNMISASYTGSISGPTPIPGLDVLKTGQLTQFNRPVTFDRSAFIQQGLYVSQSVGGSQYALCVDGTNAVKTMIVTGSVEFAIASGGNNLFNNYLTSSFYGTTDFGNQVRVTTNNQIKLPSGTNQQTGVATLDGGNPGTVTVSNSLVTAGSLIFLTKQSNGTPGAVAISSKGTGTFTITSTDNGDTDQVAWFIVNQS